MSVLTRVVLAVSQSLLVILPCFAAGLGPPPQTPELFLPGLVSTGLYERDVALSPDGRELYFGLLGNDYAAIAMTRWVDGRWSAPEIAPFSGGPVWMDLEPAFSADGQRLYFLSTRPDSGQPAEPGWVRQDIWVVERAGRGWGTPHRLGAPVDTPLPEFFPSLTASGTLYFTRGVDGKESSAIWRARRVDGRYAEPERLPAEVNVTDQVFNAAVAPDESYLVTCVMGAPEDKGRASYRINFRGADDRWSAALPLEPVLGLGPGGGISVSLSRDGRIAFFASTRRIVTPPQRLEYARLLGDRTRPGNGNSDVYWVDTSLLARLRPAGF